MRTLYVSSRSCTVLLDPEGRYEAREPMNLTLNGKPLREENRSVASIFGLEPDTEYTLGSETASGHPDHVVFRTKKETCTLNVRDFGAQGDGEKDDTAMLQAAILACPRGGRVLIPAGTYLTGPLFLKSHMTLEISEGAVLALKTDRNEFPVLPGSTPARNADGEMLLGLWEGEERNGYAAALTGIEVTDTAVIGEGTVDGRAQEGDWWVNPKVIRGAARGNLFFLMRSSHVTVQGVTFRNSPAWNLHPAMSKDLDFLNIRIEAPWDSPNTDGFDPESCSRVRLMGSRISVGDDCIAIKSGKIGIGRKYRMPCEEIEIGWCAMLDGHGGVTVGSEMAGGVRNVWAHHCYMRGNDRALRIKTRRGRGKDGVIDNILFENVRMKDIKVPLVVNALYFCDPDGHSAWVQSRAHEAVDETTPRIGSIRFEHVKATGCQGCVAYVLGLPEQPMEELAIRDSTFDFAEDAAGMNQPAMAEGVDPVRKRGLILKYAQRVELTGIRVSGMEGPMLDLQEVQEIIQE